MLPLEKKSYLRRLDFLPHVIEIELQNFLIMPHGEKIFWPKPIAKISLEYMEMKFGNTKMNLF